VPSLETWVEPIEEPTLLDGATDVEALSSPEDGGALGGGFQWGQSLDEMILRLVGKRHLKNLDNELFVVELHP
jgi:hypothetical protein